MPQPEQVEGGRRHVKQAHGLGDDLAWQELPSAEPLTRFFR